MSNLLPEELEEAGNPGSDVENGGFPGAKKAVVLKFALPRKVAVLLADMVTRRMRKGQDVSRDQLVSEGILLLVQHETGSRNRGQGE